eukprot:864882-Prorocentrum_minimum.AAC.1
MAHPPKSTTTRRSPVVAHNSSWARVFRGIGGCLPRTGPAESSSHFSANSNARLNARLFSSHEAV